MVVLLLLLVASGCGHGDDALDGAADADALTAIDGDDTVDADSAIHVDGDVVVDADEAADAADDGDSAQPNGLSGQIVYERRPISVSRLERAVEVPAPGVSVRLLDGSLELDRTITDDDGRYRFDLHDGAIEAAALRIVAAGDPPRALEVTDFDGANYSALSDTFVADTGVTVDLAIAEAANSGAFAIFDTLYTAMDVAEEAFERATALPLLRARWERGRATPYGTSYTEFHDIWILGGPSDTDEYDTSVLLHEMGHYLQFVYFMVTWVEGNPHAGEYTDPRLAWSEGWATFFSCAALDESFYLDSVGDEVWVAQDLSDLPQWGEFVADPYGGMNQTVSEWVISASLWQILEAEGDRAIGRRRSMKVITDWFDRSPAPDRGVEGYDLVDFLDGYLCLHEGDAAAAIESAVVEDRSFPYDLTPICPLSGLASLQPSAVFPSPVEAGMSCVGKPGRPRLYVPHPPIEDDVDRGSVVRTESGELLREVMIDVRPW